MDAGAPAAAEEAVAVADLEGAKFDVWKKGLAPKPEMERTKPHRTLIQKTKQAAGISIPASDLGEASDPGKRTRTTRARTRATSGENQVH